MKHVLVIDDDVQVRRVIRRLLERAGYLVTDAPDGEAGIKLHRVKPADLIITDIFMPEKEGIETIKELHNNFPDVKIVAISGGSQKGEYCALKMARVLGAIRTISKPFSCNDILETVQELLGTNRSGLESTKSAVL